MGQSKKALLQVTMLLAIFPSSGPTLSNHPSDIPSSGPTLSNPPSDLPSSGPTLSNPPSDLPSSGPTLSNPTPEGPSLSPDAHFLPPTGWLESPDPSLQIVVSSASIISESLSDVVVPTTIRSQPDPVISIQRFSEPLPCKTFHLDIHTKHGAELGKHKLQVTKHEVGYDV